MNTHSYQWTALIVSTRGFADTMSYNGKVKYTRNCAEGLISEVRQNILKEQFPHKI